MKIIACCKVCPDEQDIKITGSKELSFEGAAWKIGQYDLNAIEAGKKLAAETESSFSVLTVGGDVLSSSKIRKDILSRGADELYVAIDAQNELTDTLQTAKALAASIKEIGDVNLVLCGTGSSDMYSQAVGVQIGTLLSWSVVNQVSAIKLIGDDLLEVERTLEKDIEILEVALPAVISVTADINVPTIPGMKDIMKAGKKPVNELTADFGSYTKTVETISLLAPELADRKQILVEGDSDEQIDQLIAFLKKEAL